MTSAKLSSGIPSFSKEQLNYLHAYEKAVKELHQEIPDLTEGAVKAIGKLNQIVATASEFGILTSKEQEQYLAKLRRQNPEALKAVNQGVSPMCALMAQSGQTKVERPQVGELVKGRGVYLGKNGANRHALTL